MTADADIDAVLLSISSLSHSSWTDETARLKALEAARSLVARLETPYERFYDTVWIGPVVNLSLKTAAELKIFQHLSSETPTALADLSRQVRADPNLLRRILRVLVKSSIICEGSVRDTYLHSALSQTLVDPTGLITGLDVLYETSLTQQAKLPSYFASHHYQEPNDMEKAPFKWIEGIPERSGDRWDWLKSQPERHRNFNAFLSALRQNSRAWTELFPKEKVLEGWDGESVVLVDVGGGYGRDVSAFADAIGKGKKEVSGRVVLQDRAEVIDAVREQGIVEAKGVELIEHNFFEKNRVEGARAYFLHSVLHDWPDDPAVDILKAITSAMKAGYSKVLLMELVLPERATEWPLSAAVMDINMMCNFASRERTKNQWRGLLESAGLTRMYYHRLQGPVHIIEAGLDP